MRTQPRTLSLAARLLATSALGIGLFASPPTGLAQGPSLATAVVQAPSIGQGEEASIKTFVDGLASDLTDEPDKVMRARDALLAPLARTSSPSNAFRLRYAKVLEPTLRSTLASDNEMQQVNAMVIAGELATIESLSLIEASAKDASASVRYQAAAAARRTIIILGELPSPTLDDTAASRLLVLAGASARAENDPLVIDEWLAALSAGLGVDRYRVEAARLTGETIAHLTKAVGASPAPLAVSQGMLRTAGRLRDVATRSTNLPVDFHKASATVGGSLIAHAARLVKAKRVEQSKDDQTRLLLGEMAGAGETLVLAAAQNLQSRAVTQQNLAQSLGEGTTAGDVRFADGASKLLTPLASNPFSVPADVVTVK